MYMLVCWLIVAISYWRLSHHVQTHTNLVCFFEHTKHNHISMTFYDWDKVIEDVYKNFNKSELKNVYLCPKSKNTQNRKINRNRGIHLCLTHYFSSKSKYHLGPPIKWWGGICLKKQRSDTSKNAIRCYGNVFVQSHSKEQKPDDFIYRTMAAASSTRNLDVCMVEENEVINNSQKRTTSAIVTATQKKTKSKKDLESKYSSLWLGFQVLNLLNKQKELPMESGESTRELMKRRIDFDEAK